PVTVKPKQGTIGWQNSCLSFTSCSHPACVPVMKVSDPPCGTTSMISEWHCQLPSHEPSLRAGPSLVLGITSAPVAISAGLRVAEIPRCARNDGKGWVACNDGTVLPIPELAFGGDLWGWS